MSKKAIIAFSGGIDSAVAAHIAKSEGYDLYLLNVNYGQKNIKKELECSQRLAEDLDAKEYKRIDMTWLGELGASGVTDNSIKLDENNDDLIYVPFRNACIISACVAWAEVLDADVIYTGSEAGPWICPDNSPEFYDAFNKLVSISTRNENLKIIAPLNFSNKSQNIQKGLDLGLNFINTWTCVMSDDVACGICQPCRDRLSAFSKLSIKDPIKYENKE